MKKLIIITTICCYVLKLNGQDLRLPDNLKPPIGTLKEEVYSLISIYSKYAGSKYFVYDISVYYKDMYSKCLAYKVTYYSDTTEYKYIDLQYCEWEGDTVYVIHFDSDITNKAIKGFNIKEVTDEDKYKIRLKLYPSDHTGGSNGFYYSECNGKREKKEIEGLKE